MNSRLKQSNIVGLKELRENIEVYITRVSKGESLTVVRRNVPLFRLSPVDDEESGWESVADFTQINPDGVSASDILKAIKRIHG